MLLHIKWQDKVPDMEVLERAWIESIHGTLMHFQLRTPHGGQLPPKEFLLWGVQEREAVSWWTEERLQGHPQGLPELLQPSPPNGLNPGVTYLD